MSTTLNDLIAKLQTAIQAKNLDAAEAVGAEIKALNDQTVLTARKVVYVCNITNEPFNLTRTFGYVNVAGAKKGERYGLTAVHEYHDRIVYDDKHQISVTFPAAEVAEDIVRHGNGDAGDSEYPNSFLGLFVCAGDAPTDAELAEAEQRLHDFDVHLVTRADQRWAERHNFPAFITSAEKRAAARLGVSREWRFQPEAMVACPVCGGQMPKGAAVHAGKEGCGAILDREKAIKYGLIKPDNPAESDETELDALTTSPKRRQKTK